MASTTLPVAGRDATPPLVGKPSLSDAILSLDLGTTIGWAIQLSGYSLQSGSVSFRPSRYDGGGMRYLRFRRWLDGFAADVGGISAVYFEEVRRHAGTDAAHVFGGFLATLSTWCEQNSVPYQGVPVGTIKHFICGRGNADKLAVIEAVRARGYRPTDDNEADAIAILLWVMETRGGLR
jgi:hypothetical protein